MTSLSASFRGPQHRLPSGVVLIAGGGPIGLLLARVLSFYGVRSVLFERNKTTTKWPKMDLTNARSMEMFRKIGLDKDLREQGVAASIDQNVLISTGLSAEKPITRWDLPGVKKFRELISQTNDGTQPQEPWQRVSQTIFERWLKAICEKDPLIELHYGYKIDSVGETDNEVEALVTEVDTGVQSMWKSDYLAGCDGGSSKVRTSLSIPLDGGPIPSCALLVHFKSRDLTRLQKQGQFWHIFFLGKSGGFEAAIIAQDEKETWTTHLFLPLGVETDHMDSHDVVYRVLGGIYAPYKIKIDEILVRSTWWPNIAVTRTWNSPGLRVFLAGDSAHQNIPTGGYGMNMGIGDAFDLGWKLSSVINGHGGAALLRSYEMERKPVALRNVEHSGVHFQVHSQLKEIIGENDPRILDSDTEDGRHLRQKIHDHYQAHDGENRDLGIEMGYRYSSPVIVREEGDDEEPPFSTRSYIPTSWPGSRAPHVILSDGTSIFDKLGKFWTLLVFNEGDVGQSCFSEAASHLSLPLISVDLSKEGLAGDLYKSNLVLVRPDQHVAWRAEAVSTVDEVLTILHKVTGRIDSQEIPASKTDGKPCEAFTSSVGISTHVEEVKLEGMGQMQA